VLGALVVFTGCELVREVYRGYVRSAALGRDDCVGSIMGWADLFVFNTRC
jgi:hypothetical protein